MKKLVIWEKLIIVLSILIIVVGGIVIAGMIFLNQAPLQEVNSETESVVTISEEVKTPMEFSEKSLNILVLGIADDEEYRESTKMTDVIMVVNMDFEASQMSILQIPRDTFVGNYTDNYKINSVYKSPSDYTYSGIDGLANIIYDMFKINIDHYVTMQMDGFSDIVDAIGGVTMDVPTTLQTGSKFGKITVEEGLQTLNGQQALVVVRNRYAYANADLGRLDTQKLFLQAFAKEVKSLSLAEMASLIPSVIKCCSTDLTISQVLNYYNELHDINMDDIVAVTIPGTGGMYNTHSVYSPYAQQTAYILNEYFRPYSPDVPVEELNIQTISYYEPSLSEEDIESSIKHFEEEDAAETEEAEETDTEEITE